jgi:hypothetical protein
MAPLSCGRMAASAARLNGKKCGVHGVALFNICRAGLCTRRPLWRDLFETRARFILTMLGCLSLACQLLKPPLEA